MYLSIIVPVFNVETYLEKCVNSLLDQDLAKTDYEIILVDDGSTDLSGQICDALANAYDCIRVIHQQNGGLSKARNTGIAVARGQYIQFVDSDDYLNANVLLKLILQMERQDLDILRINYQNVNAVGEVFEPNRYSKPYVDYSENVCDGLTFLNERLGFACYAIQFLIKTSIVRQAGNGFREGLFYEDVEWTPRILLQAQRVSSCGTVVYNYLYRHNSITRNTDPDRKRKAIEDKMSLLQLFGQKEKEVADVRWFKGMTAQIVLSILMEVGRWFYSERRFFIHDLNEMRVFPLCTYHATSSAKKKIHLANLSPGFVCYFYHLKNRS